MYGIIRGQREGLTPMSKFKVRSIKFAMISNELARCSLRNIPSSVYCERIFFHAINEFVKGDWSGDIKMPLSAVFQGKVPKESEVEAFKEICRELAQCWIEDESDEGTRIILFFSVFSVDMKEKTLGVKLNGEIKKYVSSLTDQFTKIPLEIFCSLKSVYSQRLYRLFKSHVGRGGATYTLEKLSDFLAPPEYTRTSGYRFNEKILMPAIDEINDKTDLRVVVASMRSGRFIHKYTFSITDTEKLDSRQKADKRRREIFAKHKGAWPNAAPEPNRLKNGGWEFIPGEGGTENVISLDNPRMPLEDCAHIGG